MTSLDVPLRSESLVLNADTFREFAGKAYDRPMTMRGTIEKTALLLILAMGSAIGSWLFVTGQPTDGSVDVGVCVGWPFLAAIVGVPWVAFATTEYKGAARITGPIFALLEGCALGILSAIFDATNPGSLLPAVLVSFATLLSLLVLYKASGFGIRSSVWLGVSAAIMASVLVGAAVLGLRMSGIHRLDFIREDNQIGIAVSILVLVLASINLVMDFSLIELGVHNGAPEYMEWYAAMALLVCLVWLYITVGKLLIQMWLEGALGEDRDQEPGPSIADITRRNW